MSKFVAFLCALTVSMSATAAFAADTDTAETTAEQISEEITATEEAT